MTDKESSKRLQDFKSLIVQGSRGRFGEKTSKLERVSTASRGLDLDAEMHNSPSSFRFLPICEFLRDGRGGLLMFDFRIDAEKDTIAIAKLIDDTVRFRFRVQTNIEPEWRAGMRNLRVAHKKLVEEVQREIRCDGGPSAPGRGSLMDRSFWKGRTTGRVETRFHSIFRSTGESVSPVPVSGLERRARTIPRSGPKAAKAPSCPLKNQPPKKTIPRSEVKTNPKPSVKPRQPTQAPQPRTPSPLKKVTPRPAVCEVVRRCQGKRC